MEKAASNVKLSDNRIHSPGLDDMDSSIIPNSFDMSHDSATTSSSNKSSHHVDVTIGPRQKLQKAIAAVKNEAQKMERNAHYATSILKGGTWTVQSQQQYSSQRAATHKVKIIPRTYSTLPRGDDSSTTRHGVTASWSRQREISPPQPQTYPRPIKFENDIEEDVDRWVNKPEIPKFSDDIGKDFGVKRRKQAARTQQEPSTHPKPGFSYSSLIGLALKNSISGQLTVSEIYAFILENFPYFRTAPSGWKNSVRHNLSLNKCFRKVEIDPCETQTARKSCLWMISPDKIEKVEQDIRKWRERNPDPAAHGLARPQDMIAIEEGTKGLPPMTNETGRGLRTTSTGSSSSKTPELPSPPHSYDLLDFTETSNHLDVDVEMKLDFSLDDPLSFSPTPLHDSLSPPSEDSSKMPFKSLQRPFSHILASPPKDFMMSRSVLLVSPPRIKKEFELSVSPIRYIGCSSFDIARDALNDNSLMSAALGQSPYKGPVTFPAAF